MYSIKFCLIFVLLACFSNAYCESLPKGFDFDSSSYFETRIVNGSDAKPGQFPWQVHLAMYAGGSTRPSQCGGIIKNESFVLTATHCIVGATNQIHNPLRLVVTAGSMPLPIRNADWATIQQREVDIAWSHPFWDRPTITNDAALLHVSPPFVFNEYVKPIAMPSAYAEPEGRCAVSGWGITRWQGSQPNTLQFLEVGIFPNRACRALFGITREANVCILGKNGTGVCSGDSGGPLACDVNGVSTVFGIASYVAVPCGSGNPDAYVGVSHFLPIFDGLTAPTFIDFDYPNVTIEGARKLESPAANPWHVIITVIQGIRNASCAGVLIANNRVVTAASCITSNTPSVQADSEITVMAGSIKLNLLENTRQFSQVTKVWMHPQFNGNQNNIALLELFEPFVFNEFVNQIDLPKSKFDFKGYDCKLVGHGEQNKNETLLSQSLLVSSVQPSTPDVQSQCKTQLSSSSISFTDSQLCATLDGTSAPSASNFPCLGTLGAGLVCEVPESGVSCATTQDPNSRVRVLAGILAQRTSCAPKEAVLFSAVSYFQEFLSGNAGPTVVLKALNMSIFKPVPPNPPVDAIKLPTLGTGEYCTGNPYENLTNIVSPPSSIPRYLGATITVSCAPGFEIQPSMCGPKINSINVRCAYKTDKAGKWVTNLLCKASPITSSTSSIPASSTTKWNPEDHTMTVAQSEEPLGLYIAIGALAVFSGALLISLLVVSVLLAKAKNAQKAQVNAQEMTQRW